MAKQTFTTGQVLTAQQVTDLQKNDYNQTVTTVTTNYTLLAADVGTRVYMNAAGATTITVNTGLFAAGDTVWLGNIGAGSCVVTAGTATVSKFSTASLTLSQYQGAYLYFVSTGVAILYSDSAGASTPLTTKGDLFGYDTANARIPIGANATVLTADSTQSLGLKWAAAASPSYTYTAYTPTLTQNGAVAKTVDVARYVQIGKFVHAYGQLSVTGTGNAAQPVSIGYPVANANNAVDGNILLYDSSASAMYKGFDAYSTWYPTNVTTDGVLGQVSFTAALAAGDVLRFVFWYEAA